MGKLGTGKSTLARQLAEGLDLNFGSISCTKQMSVNHLLGFISINGQYIRTQFRDIFENGGLWLMDEIDSADPNVLLTLNTIENGYISFPDQIVQMHPSFRLVATANPFHAHSTYTGRSKLDFSTLDRFFLVELERDSSLELSLTSPEIVAHADIARSLLSSHGVSSTVTMRDTIRLHKLNQLSISDCIYHDVVFNKHPELYSTFKSEVEKLHTEQAKASMTQSQATSIDELWSVIKREAQVYKVRSELESMSYSSDTTFKEQAFEIAKRFIQSRGAMILPNNWEVIEKMYEFNSIYEVRFKDGTTTRIITFTERELEDIIPF